MANIAIICGYGLVGNKYRTYEEMLGLDEYYDTIAYILKNSKISKIVFTGGKTNLLFPEISEAKSAMTYYKLVSKNYTINILRHTLIPEERSTTSHGNIYHSIIKLVKQNYFNKNDDTLHIFCDEPRWFKMQVICWFYLRSNGINYKINPCNRIDTTKKSTWYFQLILGIPKMLLEREFWTKYNRLKVLINGLQP